MILKQYYLGCLSHASYLVGDEATRSAVVVDPQRDVDQYIRDAQAQGLTIRDVVLTHFHADFVAGHLELARRTGASISLGANAQAAYPFTPRHEGDTLRYGSTELRVLETPGHTPEGISLVAYDLAKDPANPQAVLTGDTLFAGDVGRPDLMASQGVTADELAGKLYDSLHGKLLALPDSTTVYPAHGPGSLCGSGDSTARWSTIGKERLSNEALQIADRQEFITRITSDLPDVPDYFSRDAIINKSQHDPLEDVIREDLKPLSVDQAVLLRNQGALVIDVRDPDEFAAGHMQGAVNIGMDGRFAQWAGALLAPDQPLVLVTPPGREQEAVTRLARVGLEGVCGFVEGGQPAIGTRPELVSTSPRTYSLELRDALTSEHPPVVVDVRTDDEYRKAHLAGSIHVPLLHLRASLDQIPADQPVVVHCQSGYRSSMAVSLLEEAGRHNVTDLAGGIQAWQAAGLPTVGEEAPPPA